MINWMIRGIKVSARAEKLRQPSAAAKINKYVSIGAMNKSIEEAARRGRGERYENNKV